MNHKRFYIPILILFFLLTIRLVSNNTNLKSIKNMLAGVFFVDSTSTEYLVDNFKKAKEYKGKIKILIVPGHDDGIGGTEFNNIKERDINIQIAESLTNLLRKEKEFDVHLTKNKIQYNETIEKYISSNVSDIEKFSKEYKEIMNSLVNLGLIDNRQTVLHNQASSEIRTRLYGINKWANENKVDLVIHIHLNDYPRRNISVAGKYSGIAMYIPDSQFSNANASKDIAEKVFSRLTKYFPQSDMPLESDGIIEDQELIAVGAFNTLDPAVLLIEYGYIYEDQFLDEETRAIAITELATQTYFGILDFFNETTTDESIAFESDVLPYFWNKDLKTSAKSNGDTFAMQLALSHKSLYPPKGKSKNECPVSGVFGPCTKSAVIEFQKKNNIEPSSGFVGPVTRNKLNEMFK